MSKSFRVDSSSPEDVRELFSYYPEHQIVFENICLDIDLMAGLFSLDNKYVLEARVHGTFIPTLLRHELVTKDKSTNCGYKPLVSKIELDHDSFTLAQSHNYIEGMTRIANAARKHANPETNVVAAALSGTMPKKDLDAMFDELRAVIKKYNGIDQGNTRYVLAITGKEIQR